MIIYPHSHELSLWFHTFLESHEIYVHRILHNHETFVTKFHELIIDLFKFHAFLESHEISVYRITMVYS